MRDEKGRFMKGHPSPHKGKKLGPLSKETKEKKSQWCIRNNWRPPMAPEEEKSPHWKGNEVGYGALHKWVIKHLGQPDTCEHCGREGLRGLQIHWANKSKKYKRDLDDWIRLCMRCHGKYDGNEVWKVAPWNDKIFKK